MQTLKRYYWLAKPGIVYSNTLAAMAGFFFASGQTESLDIASLIGVVIGTGLVISSACVLNNFIDRKIDRQMERTSWRATATGTISMRAVALYTIIVGIVGFAVLLTFTTILTVALGIVAYVAYIILYGIAKRTTIHSTLIGTISGALPLVGGYGAVTNTLDLSALLLFLVMVCWQMPHFYAIGMRRSKEYAAANLPIMPVIKGMRITKIQILVYIGMFAVVNELFTLLHVMGYTYGLIMTIIAGAWFVVGLRGFDTQNDQAWARNMFLASLAVLLALFGMLAIGSLLP